MSSLRIWLGAAALLMAACTATRAQPTVVRTPAEAGAVLQKAERDLAQGDADDAREALDTVAPAQLDARQRAQISVLDAEISLAQDQPLQALQALPPAGEIREPALAARIEAARAQALFRLGDPIGGVQAMLARERWLPEDQRPPSRDSLWAQLREADLDTASGARLAQAGKAARGWIELAIIGRSVWARQPDFDARVAQWRLDFPDHPAADRIAELSHPQLAGQRSLERVALVLPLSGPLAAGGEAVRDGFLAAWYRARESGAARPVVEVRDSGATPDSLQAAYRSALDAGAEFIVGPLRREDVAALADSGRPAVPVLALNYLDPGKDAPFNFFTWGLAPEDEARQAAERAVADRDFRALALVPSGDWGERVLKAFRERLETLGGHLVAEGRYAPTERDWSEPIRRLLALDASQHRHDVLTSTLGVRTEFQPRRRDDADFIFIAARPDQARLLAPQLRFHRSGNLPMYTTAQVYDGEPPTGDLDGLRFCDMPWMLAQDGEWAGLRSQLRTLFPSRTREYTRLLALGYDAFGLIALIDSGALQPGSFVPAASGMLSLREDRSIARSLTCAEIRNGALRPLDGPPAR